MTSSDFRITLEAGKDTEELLEFILEDLDRSVIAEMSVDRDYDRPDGLASEPITISVALGTAIGATAIRVGRAIERWLENRRQETHLKALITAAEHSPELAELVADVTKAHASVAVSYELGAGPEPAA
jgi:hypothetical protein